MDRRNVWRVGSHGGGGGGVLVGTISGRPAAGSAGRIYIVSPVVTTATAVAGGTAFPASIMDAGSAWDRKESLVYTNTTIITATAGAEKVVAAIGLKPNILAPDRRLSVFWVARVNGGTATAITITTRAKLGSSSNVASVANPTITTSQVQLMAMEFSLVGTTATSARVGMLRHNAPTTNVAIGPPLNNLASKVLNPTVSQLLTFTVALGKNIAGSAYKVLYVEARWTP